jgi:hypothetical protein
MIDVRFVIAHGVWTRIRLADNPTCIALGKMSHMLKLARVAGRALALLGAAAVLLSG